MKEMRRGYNNAVDSGIRSGSGKLVINNYDILKEICGEVLPRLRRYKKMAVVITREGMKKK